MAPRLSSTVRRLIVANAISALGTGLVLPLTLIYLHRARHIPLTTTGVLLAIPGLVGLAAVPLAGTWMDRFGARRVLVSVLVLLAVGEAALAGAARPATAAGALVLVGAGQGTFFPALTTLVVQLAPDAAMQQRAFAVNFTVLNGAIGVGALAGAAVVDVRHPGTFQLLFVLNAVSCLVEAVVVAALPAAGPVHPTSAGGRTAGYRDVFADPLLRRILGLGLLLAMSGYAALDAVLPAYANVAAHVPAKVVSLSLAANTLLIVLAQLVVLRWLRGRRRTQGITVVGAVWTLSWVLLATCVLPGSLHVRSGLVIAFGALFGLGETFMAPTIAPLTNTLAPEAIRGRTNALYSGMFTVAFVVSPPIAAAFVSAGLGAVWLGALAVAAAAVAVAATRLGRRLTLTQDTGLTAPALPAVPEMVGPRE